MPPLAIYAGSQGTGSPSRHPALERSGRGGNVGDLICRVTIETPVNLTKHQKELLRAFGDSLAGEHTRHSPRASSWLDGVKKFLEDMKFT